MNGYFYHGIEPYYGDYGRTLEIVLKILKEGLKTRNEIRNHDDDEFNHICLYKKNNEWDYADKRTMHMSARSGWIDNCFVFIISPDIEATKAPAEMTDLVDEYRSLGDISKDKIQGIALPFESIKEYLDEETLDEEVKEDKEKLKKMLPIITEYIVENNMFYMDSDMPNFTDELDNSLKNIHKK